jgi:hypothetical protein
MLVCVFVLIPILALAEPKTAGEWFTEGETQYNLGNFEQAADAFKQGFALENVEAKKAVYLYNVGQAYRQARKCSEAIFFYKRFLALKANDTAKPLPEAKRAEIEKFIEDLEQCVKEQEKAKNRPPEDTEHQTGSGSGSDGSGAGSAKKTRVGRGGEEGDDGEGVTKGTKSTQAKLVSARLEGGASAFSAGNLKWPVQGTGTLIAGYPLHPAPKLELDLGAALAFTPVAFDNTFTGAKQTATFTEVLADVGVGYDVIKNLAVRGDLGLGVLSFNGIQQMGSPFTKNGAGATGPLGMFALRVGVSADYAFTPNVFGTVTPFALSFSPAPSGLVFTSLVRVDFMVGVGYRM